MHDLKIVMLLSYLRIAAGLHFFCLFLYRTVPYVLHPLFELIHYQKPLPADFAFLTFLVWRLVPHARPVIVPPPPSSRYAAYADAIRHALELHVPNYTGTVFTPATAIYRNEVWAFVLLLFAVLSRTLSYGDNHSIVCGLRSGQCQSLPWNTTLVDISLVTTESLSLM